MSKFRLKFKKNGKIYKKSCKKLDKFLHGFLDFDLLLNLWENIGIEIDVKTCLSYLLNLIIILTFVGVPQRVAMSRIVAVSKTLNPVTVEAKMVNKFNISCNNIVKFLEIRDLIELSIPTKIFFVWHLKKLEFFSLKKD